MAALRGAIDSFRAYGAVFRNRDLRRLQLAGIGSTLGTWAYGVGLAVFAFDAGGARAVGLLYAARWGMAAVAAPWLALLADRRSRRSVMVAADLIRAGILATMAVLAFGGAPAWPTFVLAVCSTMVSSVFVPALADCTAIVLFFEHCLVLLGKEAVLALDQVAVVSVGII